MKTPLGNEFICRVCGCIEYTEVESERIVLSAKHEDTRDLASFETGAITIAYQCIGCSVYFCNADRFTKAQKDAS